MTKKAYFCRRITRNVCMTALEALKTYYGYESFRPLQEEIINSVLAGHNTLALLPTGGGKSLCFQIPTLVQETLCLVITPLIALMHDQVEHLLAREIRAAAIHMGMSYDEQRRVLDNCQFGPYRFLYVSPERLESADFRARFHLDLRCRPVRNAGKPRALPLAQRLYGSCRAHYRNRYLRLRTSA